MKKSHIAKVCKKEYQCNETPVILSNSGSDHAERQQLFIDRLRKSQEYYMQLLKEKLDLLHIEGTDSIHYCSSLRSSYDNIIKLYTIVASLGQSLEDINLIFKNDMPDDRTLIIKNSELNRYDYISKKGICYDVEETIDRIITDCKCVLASLEQEEKNEENAREIFGVTVRLQKNVT